MERMTANAGKAVGAGKAANVGKAVGAEKMPCAGKMVADAMQLAAMHDGLVRALRAFCERTGHAQAVLGVSGGLDSAVVAALAVEALGAGCVHGVLLPGPFTSRESAEDARALCEALGIEWHSVSIEAPFRAFCEELAPACGGAVEGTVAQNIQARSRMVCLMALANRYGWMLLNTGNLSEACMGYTTLYGDAAGVCAPIGGLYKTQVRALARWMNDRAVQAGRPEPIPQRIIDKPPSAELAAGQTDEGSLGISYDALDAILFSHREGGLDREGLLAAGFAPGDVDNVLARLAANAFKRALLPPALEPLV